MTSSASRRRRLHHPPHLLRPSTTLLSPARRPQVRIFSSLSHPYVIKYHHHARVGRSLCIFMEYAQGGTLEQAIRARQGTYPKPFAPALVVRWLSEIVGALQHLHEQCVLHRDLKSANIFLHAKGDGAQLRLGDFGVSRELSTYTHFASTAVGTPHYMAPAAARTLPLRFLARRCGPLTAPAPSQAPEVLASAPYAHAADVWSVGIVLYELLTLKRPFSGEHLGSLVTAIMSGEYNSDALDACPHPPALRELASRARLLHPSPDERTNLDELQTCAPPPHARRGRPPLHVSCGWAPSAHAPLLRAGTWSSWRSRWKCSSTRARCRRCAAEHARRGERVRRQRARGVLFN